MVHEKFRPINLKKPLAKWQNQIAERGWDTLYLENHDQPRSVSRFGSLDYYHESAKMLATMLYFQKGTPFIYQGRRSVCSTPLSPTLMTIRTSKPITFTPPATTRIDPSPDDEENHDDVTRQCSHANAVGRF